MIPAASSTTSPGTSSRTGTSAHSPVREGRFAVSVAGAMECGMGSQKREQLLPLTRGPYDAPSRRARQVGALISFSALTASWALRSPK